MIFVRAGFSATRRAKGFKMRSLERAVIIKPFVGRFWLYRSSRMRVGENRVGGNMSRGCKTVDGGVRKMRSGRQPLLHACVA